jgi:hypothetical protein
VSDEISLAFRWEPIGRVSIDEMGKPVFPQAAATPGVYRFEIDGDKALVYFGEAADLRRRFSHYRSPGPSQQTNLRIRDLFCRALNASGQGEVSLAHVISFDATERTAHLDLRLKAARVLIESAAIVLARSRCERSVLNLDANFDRMLGDK